MTTRLWMALLAAPLCAQSLQLAPQVLEVKLQQGRVLVLEGNGQGGVVKVLSRQGRLERSIEAGAGETGLRRVELKDFTLASDGTLYMSLGAIYNMGVTARLLASYPLQGEPRFVTLDDTVCFKLAADAPTGVWCLGPGLEETLFHRVTGEAAGLWSLVPPKKIRLLPGPEGERWEVYDPGRMGVPAMLAPLPGILLTWMPNAGGLLELSTTSGEWRLHDVPVATNGRAILSFAAGPAGVFALMPLRGPSDAEQLTTPYAVFRLDMETGRWRIQEKMPRFPRGTQLAGLDGNELVVWNRSARSLDWVPLR